MAGLLMSGSAFGWEAVFIVFIAAAFLGAVFCFSGHKKLKRKTDELDAYNG